MTNHDPNIVLTNDDGIDSPGLAALHRSLSAIGEATVFVQATGKSGNGRTVSMGWERDHEQRGAGGVDVIAGRFACAIPHRAHDLGYAIEGTPCDCVALSVHGFEDPPNVVVSGCNPGPNVGADTLI